MGEAVVAVQDKWWQIQVREWSSHILELICTPGESQKSQHHLEFCGLPVFRTSRSREFGTGCRILKYARPFLFRLSSLFSQYDTASGFQILFSTFSAAVEWMACNRKCHRHC